MDKAYTGMCMPTKRDFMKIDNIISFYTICLLSVVLAGCNGVKFRTNAEEYVVAKVEASTVDLYSPSELYNHENDPLGEVFTSFCSVSADHLRYPIPSLSALKNDLRGQTADRGGNALVITECGEQKYPTCTVYLECAGLAYYLKSWD
ncbi:hypothetical protein [Shewanella sp. WPAGA9]|uniref:hypothetical protein n=1 Tax=Shewanella sp. ENK2 TaxID=2775245 RepID=UPI00177FC42C|nr:hypothetical protein [Shewanella sp. WPAGA9]